MITIPAEIRLKLAQEELTFLNGMLQTLDNGLVESNIHSDTYASIKRVIASRIAEIIMDIDDLPYDTIECSPDTESNGITMLQF